jgi:hypothetical protein
VYKVVIVTAIGREDRGFKSGQGIPTLQSCSLKLNLNCLCLYLSEGIAKENILKKNQTYQMDKKFEEHFFAQLDGPINFPFFVHCYAHQSIYWFFQPICHGYSNWFI